MSVARVRVEARDRGGHWEDRDKEFRILLGKFRKAVSEAGIINTYKQKETYESKGRKRRRKKREAELARLKAKLKENFAQRGEGKPRKDDKRRGHGKPPERTR